MPQGVFAAGNFAGMSLEMHSPDFNSNISVGKSNGTFLYQYGFDFPAGRTGLNPDLSLQYSSEARNDHSPYGYGWTMDIPEIGRINRYGSEKLYTHPVFVSSFSGELSKQNETEYIPRVNDGNYSYEFLNNSWVATSKDGLRYTFGATASSREADPANLERVYRWLLESAEDLNGNKLTYSYFVDNNKVFLSQIVYVSENDVDLYTIKFKYTAQQLNTEYYSAGFKQKNTKLLSWVEIFKGAEKVRKYKLSYKTADSAGRKLLEKVSFIEVVGGAEKEKPPTTFSYHNSPIGFTKKTEEWILPVDIYNSGAKDYSLIAIRDVNGDAYPDVVYSAEDYGTKLCAVHAQQTYINDTRGGWIPNDCNGKWETPRFLKQHNSQAHDDHGSRIFDYNGDYLDDFVWARTDDHPEDETEMSIQSELYTNTGEASATWQRDVGVVPIPFVIVKSNAENGVQVVDVNGDGLNDFAWGRVDDDTYRSYQNIYKEVYLNSTDGWTRASSSKWVLPHATIDENRDGKEVSTYAQFADINNDGLVDFLFKHDDNNLGERMGMNTGSIWITPESNWRVPYYTQSEEYASANRSDVGTRMWDITGNGLPDFVIAGDGMAVYLNQNNSNSPWKEAFIDIPLKFTFGNGKSTSNTMADLNADGMMDLVSAIRYKNEKPYVTYLASNDRFTDLLETITDPSGGVTNIKYQMSSQYRDENGDILNPKLPVLVTTVQEILVEDGNNSFLTSYEYADGHFYYADKYNRRFAGFGKVTKTTDLGTEVTYYHQGNGDNLPYEVGDSEAKIGQVYLVETYEN